ncbi:hypothetical protein [Streptomyces albogriseolus]|uniref:hypothetical protein n=1 Tax=Streptomyces albogriseolus TaxID=1887 RepID=UPI0033A8012C
MSPHPLERPTLPDPTQDGSRLIRSAGAAPRDGVEPGTPRAAALLREPIGDAGPAAVPKRRASAAGPRLDRHRAPAAW